jgi:long-chain fatty acid transport protein
LSVTEPFWLDNRYGDAFWGRYDTLNAQIDTVDVQGTVAVRLNPWRDAGFGVSAQKTEAMLEVALPNLSPLLPDGRSSVSGDGWNYGWSVGLQAHRDRMTLGASYRSAIEHDLDARVAVTGLLPPLDTVNFSTAGTARFTTPWMAVVGARFRATPQLTLNGQVQRFGWSEYDAIRIAFPGGGDTIRQDYDDTTSAAVGADYAVNSRWTVRGGFQFDQTPTPRHLREPGVPDSDSKLYALGASLRLRPNVTVDGGVGYRKHKGAPIYEDSLVYAGTPAATMTNVRGRVSGHDKTASVGLRWKF